MTSEVATLSRDQDLYEFLAEPVTSDAICSGASIFTKVDRETSDEEESAALLAAKF